MTVYKAGYLIYIICILSKKKMLKCCHELNHFLQNQTCQNMLLRYTKVYELPIADLYRWSWESGGLLKVCCIMLINMLRKQLRFITCKKQTACMRTLFWL